MTLVWRHEWYLRKYNQKTSVVKYFLHLLSWHLYAPAENFNKAESLPFVLHIETQASTSAHPHEDKKDQHKCVLASACKILLMHQKEWASIGFHNRAEETSWCSSLTKKCARVLTYAFLYGSVHVHMWNQRDVGQAPKESSSNIHGKTVNFTDICDEQKVRNTIDRLVSLDLLLWNWIHLGDLVIWGTWMKDMEEEGATSQNFWTEICPRFFMIIIYLFIWSASVCGMDFVWPPISLPKSHW